MMKIYLGADHNGFQLKELLKEHLTKAGHEVIDQGDEQRDQSDDFPLYAARVATALLGSEDTDSKGILMCGSGQGMIMAANRYKGIRASLVWNESEAFSSRNDDDSNILCLPAHELKDASIVKVIVDTWLKTPFAGSERFKRRIKQLDELN
jgi:ribose 5-phosphate isomerase B